MLFGEFREQTNRLQDTLQDEIIMKCVDDAQHNHMMKHISDFRRQLRDLLVALERDVLETVGKR